MLRFRYPQRQIKNNQKTIIMKSYKTTLAGILAGLPVAIQSILDAYNAGQFTGKSLSQLAVGIGVILIGVYAKDHNVTGGTTQQ